MTNFKELSMETLKKFSDLEDVSDESAPHAIRDLIEKIRSSLSLNAKQTGMWEAIELNYADQAIDEGFPKVALIACIKALGISRLSSEEYKFGFELLRRQTAILLERDALRDNARTVRESTAHELSAEQEQAALNLRSEQENTAVQLKSAQNAAASALTQQQENAASILIENNMLAAFDLSDKETVPTTALAGNEAAKILQQQITCEYSTWAPDRYSITPPANVSTDLDNDPAYQKEAIAGKLKDQQSQTACDLNESQSGTASDLKKVQEVDAEELKNKQKTSAVTLKENQTIKALRKTIVDGDNTGKK